MVAEGLGLRFNIRRPWGACWMGSPASHQETFSERRKTGQAALMALGRPGPQGPGGPGPKPWPQAPENSCQAVTSIDFVGPDTLHQTCLLAPLDLLQESQILPGVVVVLANYQGIFIVLFWFLAKSLKSLTHWPVFAPVILLIIANPKPSADLGGRVVSVRERVKTLSFFPYSSRRTTTSQQAAGSLGPKPLGARAPSL